MIELLLLSLLPLFLSLLRSNPCSNLSRDWGLAFVSLQSVVFSPVLATSHPFFILKLDQVFVHCWSFFAFDGWFKAFFGHCWFCCYGFIFPLPLLLSIVCDFFSNNIFSLSSTAWDWANVSLAFLFDALSISPYAIDFLASTSNCNFESSCCNCKRVVNTFLFDMILFKSDFYFIWFWFVIIIISISLDYNPNLIIYYFLIF